MTSCAAASGPTPGWSSSCGASVRASVSIAPASSRSSSVSRRTRRATARSACSVPRSSTSGRRSGRTVASRRSSWARLSGRSSLRSGSGLVISRSRSWQTAARRALTAPSRAAISARSASRSPPARGSAAWLCASTLRAARIASSASLLPPERRLAPQAPHLEHPLALAAQEAAEASPERAGFFDRERAPTRRVLFPELQGARIAAAVRLNARLEYDRAGPNLDDRERVHVAVRVDADHVVQLICKHPTHLQPRFGGHTPVPVWDEDRGRQNCDESRRQAADRLLIRPASGRQAGTGLFARTDHWKDTRCRGHSGIESQTKSTGATLTTAPDGTPAHSQCGNVA